MNEFVFKANYHQDPSALHVNCEAPRAYFIPYQSEKTALAGNRNASHRFLTLCGDWDFTFYKSLCDVPDLSGDPRGPIPQRMRSNGKAPTGNE